MRLVRNVSLLLIVSTPLLMQACSGDTDESTQPTLDSGVKLDATSPDVNTTDSATPQPDANVTDANVTDANVKDSSPDANVTEAGDAAADAASCPIGINDTISATLKLTVDDYAKTYVNGVMVGDKQTTWGTVDTYNVTLYRNPTRKNVIAVAGRNAFTIGGLDRGLIVDLTYNVTAADGGADAGDGGADAADAGGPVHIVTDTSWKMLPESGDGGVDAAAPDGGVPAWVENVFDDTAWAASIDVGPHGTAPWGAVLGSSAARWIWSYDSASASSKPNDETVYFRKSFYLDVSGTPQSTPQACP